MEYNGSEFSFLGNMEKKFLKMTEKANQILGVINYNNELTFDFTEAVERFKKRPWDLDNFCNDEALAHFLLNKNDLEDTRENREIYYLSLRNHLLKLQREEGL